MIHKNRKLTRCLGCALAALGMAAVLTACGIGSGGKTDPSGQSQQTAEDPSGGSLDGTGGASEEVQDSEEESGFLHYCTVEELGVPFDRLSAVVDLSGYTLADLSGCGYDHDFSGAETEELREQLEKLDCVDARELHIYEDYAGWSLVLQLDYQALREEIESYYADLDTENMTPEELQAAVPQEALDEYWDKIQRYPGIEFTMALTTAGYCVLGPDDICCVLTPEFQQYLSQYREIPEKTAEKVYYSVPCQEPETETECRDAAVLCVTEWLKDCGKEGTDPKYRNHGFTIAEERKNNFRAGGYVDGRKEFLVEVCFTAEYDEDAKFYSSHEIAHYTEAGTFWEGVYLRARFCWEDGMVSLLDPMGSDLYLDGFQTSEYRNFFDYARRSDLEQDIQDSFVYYMGVVVSQNLTVTENGKEINLDIFQRGETEDRGDTIFGNPHFRTYRGEEKLYGTGVYFTDNGTSTKDIEYPKNFRLTFDNYTNDGNPDYAILYDTDENGAYYAIESFQIDGRVFNYSGRAYEGGVYVAGCFDPSPRLQRTEDVAYIGWKIDETGNYVPTAWGSSEMELPEINMYSDRLYLPGTLKLYLPEENTVTCFLWNNTGEPMDTEKAFEIQRLEGEDWATVARGESAASKTVAPREYAEMTYDLNLIPDRKAGRYRILQRAGGSVGFGEFLLAGESRGDMEVSPVLEVLPEGCLTASVILTNNGVEPLRIPDLRLRREGGGEIPIWFKTGTNLTYLNGGEEKKLQFFCAGNGLVAGTYEILLDGEKKASFEVKSNSGNSRILEVQLERGEADQEVLLTVKNQSKESVELEDFRFSQLREDGYEMCFLAPGELSLEVALSGEEEETDLKLAPGESREILLANQMLILLNDEVLKLFYEQMQEYGEDLEELEEMGITADSTYEEFAAAFRKEFMVDTETTLLAEIQYSLGGNEMLTKVKFDLGQGAE